MAEIYFIEYRHTRYYLLKTEKGILAVDNGWPATFRAYARLVREKGFSIKDIKWAVVTHFHIDHAGLSGDFIERGIELAVLENQLSGIDEMEEFMKRKHMQFTEIDRERITVLKEKQTREWLKKAGIEGEIVITDGHSPDSISLVLDSGIAFIGDLYPPSMITDEDIRTIKSWQKLKKLGVRTAMPSHFPAFDLKPDLFSDLDDVKRP